eukprot:9480543-Pyramimonas_sp.AAC.1
MSISTVARLACNPWLGTRAIPGRTAHLVEELEDSDGCIEVEDAHGGAYAQALNYKREHGAENAERYDHARVREEHHLNGRQGGVI